MLDFPPLGSLKFIIKLELRVGNEAPNGVKQR